MSEIKDFNEIKEKTEKIISDTEKKAETVLKGKDTADEKENVSAYDRLRVLLNNVYDSMVAINSMMTDTEISADADRVRDYYGACKSYGYYKLAMQQDATAAYRMLMDAIVNVQSAIPNIGEGAAMAAIDALEKAYDTMNREYSKISEVKMPKENALSDGYYNAVAAEYEYILGAQQELTCANKKLLDSLWSMYLNPYARTNNRGGGNVINVYNRRGSGEDIRERFLSFVEDNIDEHEDFDFEGLWEIMNS